MKVSINLDTGLMIESQSHARDETLLANAAMCGFTNVAIRVVTQDEHVALIATRNAAHA